MGNNGKPSITQTVKSIVSETHIYQSKQWDLLHKL